MMSFTDSRISFIASTCSIIFCEARPILEVSTPYHLGHLLFKSMQGKSLFTIVPGLQLS